MIRRTLPSVIEQKQQLPSIASIVPHNNNTHSHRNHITILDTNNEQSNYNSFFNDLFNRRRNIFHTNPEKKQYEMKKQEVNKKQSQYNNNRIYEKEYSKPKKRKQIEQFRSKQIKLKNNDELVENLNQNQNCQLKNNQRCCNQTVQEQIQLQRRVRQLQQNIEYLKKIANKNEFLKKNNSLTTCPSSTQTSSQVSLRIFQQTDQTIIQKQLNTCYADRNTEFISPFQVNQYIKKFGAA